jgi:GET complex subunit GET2
MLVALALPHLPPPFPSIILNILKYFQMGGLFLDDVAGLVVGVGFLILFAGWSALGS